MKYLNQMADNRDENGFPIRPEVYYDESYVSVVLVGNASVGESNCVCAVQFAFNEARNLVHARAVPT